MTLIQLIRSNLRFFRKEHQLLLVGTILSTAILTAALIIGDSVSYSLNRQISKRLGSTQQIIRTQERFFPASFSDALTQELQVETAPVLLLQAALSSDQSELPLPKVQVCGVDARFWRIGGVQPFDLKADEVVVNEQVAARLHVKVGDEVVLRIRKPSFVTENAPFVSDESNRLSLRLKVVAIAGEQSFGGFSIQTNQQSVPTVFLDLHQLSSTSFKTDYANLMLLSKNNFSVAEINTHVQRCWSLPVLNLHFRSLPLPNKLELASDRVFLEDTLLRLLQKSPLHPEPVLTYLVNSIEGSSASTPYSFVSALSSYPGIQLGMHDIVLNSWLARDLKVGMGDSVRLKYFAVGPYRRLQEKTQTFRVKQIVAIQGFAADRDLMPAFDGLAGVDKCTDWKAGIPVDFSKIRPKDEQWWTDYRGTPKAFVSYPAAVACWGNRYGSATSVRFDASTDTTAVKELLLHSLNPASVGLNVVDVQADSKWAASNAVNFAQLFLGLSFFLILAALLLSSLLFSMMLTQRQKEQSIYRALGLPTAQIRRIYFGEGLFNLLAGSLLGVVVALLFSKLILFLLNSIWYDIVRTSSIEWHILPSSLIVGFASNVLLAVLVVVLTLRKQFRRSKTGLKIKQPTIRWIFWLSILLFGVVFAFSFQKDMFQNSSLFFALGSLLMLSLTTGFSRLLAFFQKKPVTSLFQLALRNLAYQSRRNLTLTLLVAIGVFLLVSIASNRVDFSRDASDRRSGTGGYTFFCETSIPINADLSTPEGKEKLGLDASDASFVQLLRLESEDASCLNLNRIQQPSVLGVNPAVFTKRSSFSFASSSNWTVLNQKLGPGCIPAVADQTVITWGMGKAVGDSIRYLNERGDSIYLVLVAGLNNSIFQGNLLISEQNFREHFPSIAGSSLFLAEVKPEHRETLRSNLSEALRSYGIQLEETSERLAQFNSVTNTYLDIFLALGGLALILATFGLAIVLIRSIDSEKRPFAMMQAYGIERKELGKVVALEYVAVVAVGLFIGLLSALTASLPSWWGTNPAIPHQLLLALLSLFILNCLFWIRFGTRRSLKSEYLNDLRND